MRPIYVFTALLLGAAACTASDTSGDDTVALSNAAAAPNQRVLAAARVAKAIERTPAAADSILAAAGYTVESFEQLMYEIAADSAQAAAYAAERGR